MSEQKWTKGPWELRIGRVFKDSPAFGFSILAKGKSAAICNCGIHEHGNILPGIYLPLGHKLLPQFYTHEELEANGRILNAAPTLFAALQREVSNCPTCGGEEALSEICPRCKESRELLESIR